MGELAAWLIGWDLILEYAISNAAVAVFLVRILSKFSERFAPSMADLVRYRFPFGASKSEIISSRRLRHYAVFSLNRFQPAHWIVRPF